MRIDLGVRRPRGLAASAIAAGALAAVLAGCGGSGNASGTGASAGAGSPNSSSERPASAAKCGLGNGRKAAGAPIKIGAIVTSQPGIDFTDETKMAAAFFACVNDNGGVHGRPVKYIVETDQTDAAQDQSLAKQLVDGDKVDAMVGDFSLIDCTVNHGYYESKGLYVIGAGGTAECFTTPNSAAVNMGPRYSSDGAAQYLIGLGIKKLVFETPNVPGAGYITAGPAALAKAAGIPYESVLEHSPIQDANSVALQLVDAAGAGGGVVINDPPPEALKILRAVQRLGLESRVKWGCSTPCNTDFLAQALGPAWNDKLFVNAELNLADAPGSDSALYRQVRQRYGPGISLGSFSQMGFLLAKIATDRMLTIKGPITRASVNSALRDTRDYRTDLLCKPWYYLQAPAHIPNNTDRTVTPQNGKMVEKQGCFAISTAEPDIAHVRQIERQQGL